MLYGSIAVSVGGVGPVMRLVPKCPLAAEVRWMDAVLCVQCCRSERRAEKIVGAPVGAPRYIVPARTQVNK
jgi:hypothetical protein